MAQTNAPDGYLPYRLFSYSDRKRVCTLRPEQVVGIVVSHRNAQWRAEITLRENLVEVEFGDEEVTARGFERELRNFVEADALRNQHNAALRKGRTDG